MSVSIIAAVGTNGVIGINNDLPWRLSADLRRFKQLTTGHTIVITEDCVRRIGKHFKMGDERIDLAIKKRVLVIPESLASQMLSDSKVAE